MTGKTSSDRKVRECRAGRGFSLVEILIVVLIIGILVGVVGSIMGGFVTNFEVTDDQTIARRRAQDVFNILHVPMLTAGLGLPSEELDYYFSGLGGSQEKAPVADWTGPVQVVSPDVLSSTDGGWALRLLYSVSTGVKNGGSEVTNFSSASGINTLISSAVIITLTEAPPMRPDHVNGIEAGDTSTAAPLPLYSLVTFPGIHMHPLFVTNINSGVTPPTISLIGRTPHIAIASNDVIDRNMIRAYHDMYSVKAGVAYVDGNSTFIFADASEEDVSDPSFAPSPFPAASAAPNGGYRVEGIKAIYFEQDTASHLVTVYVIAEGDNAMTGRDNAGSASQSFRTESRWRNVSFESDIYYEEFVMTWRTRNVEIISP